MKIILLRVFALHLFGIIIASPGFIARSKCIEYARRERNCTDFTCNSRINTRNDDQMEGTYRVIDGSPVNRFDYPHMAAIGYGNISELHYECGGTLLSENFVVTAAHCREDRVRGIAAAVRLGSTNLLFRDANTRIIPVDEVIVHPDYTPRYKYNDIALLRLVRKVDFNSYIWPACINTDPINTNWPFVTAIGFGITALANTVGSDTLLQVRLNIIPREICRKAYEPREKYSQSIIESQLCAGDLNINGHKDTCNGDSGGPLQILLGSPIHMYVIVGITSFGKKCGFSRIPAVYTNIGSYVPWIEEVVWGDS